MKKYIIPASLVAPRAQVLGVRWYAEQRAAARMALAALGVTP